MLNEWHTNMTTTGVHQILQRTRLTLWPIYWKKQSLRFGNGFGMQDAFPDLTLVSGHVCPQWPKATSDQCPRRLWHVDGRRGWNLQPCDQQTATPPEAPEDSLFLFCLLDRFLACSLRRKQRKSVIPPLKVPHKTKNCSKWWTAPLNDTPSYHCCLTLTDIC